MFRQIAPLFFVKDTVATVDYFVNALGFDRPPLWGDPPCFAMPSREGLTVMIKTAEKPDQIRSNNPDPTAHCGPWDAYIWVDDARAFYETCKQNGANIAYEPTLMTEYNNWEFAVRDLDNHLIAFGSHAGA